MGRLGELEEGGGKKKWGGNPEHLRWGSGKGIAPGHFWENGMKRRERSEGQII